MMYLTLATGRDIEIVPSVQFAFKVHCEIGNISRMDRENIPAPGSGTRKAALPSIHRAGSEKS